jgi:hypothetical protein
MSHSHPIPRRSLAALVASVACVLAAGAAEAAPQSHTLLTGDRIDASAGAAHAPRVAITRGLGREHAAFRTHAAHRRDGGDEVVVAPLDAPAAALRLGAPRVARAAAPDDLEVQLHGVPRLPGQATTYAVLILDSATHDQIDAFDFDADTTIPLAPGSYDFLTFAIGDDGASVAMAQLGVAIAAAGTVVTFDARPARPVAVAVERPVDVQTYSVTMFAGPAWTGLLNTVPYVVPMTATPDHRFALEVRAELEGQDAATGEDVRYHLAFRTPDAIDDPGVRRVRDADLGVHRAHYLAKGQPIAALRCDFLSNDSGQSSCLMQAATVPGDATELYSRFDTAYWTSQLNLAAAGDPDGASEMLVSGPLPFVDHPLDVTWNKAPLMPELHDDSRVLRDGDTLDVALSLLSPAELDQTHVALPGRGATGSTTLLRDGVTLATSDRPGSGRFTLPPDDASYTLVAKLDRVAPWSDLGTHAEATWTFRSAHTDAPTAPHLCAVRVIAETDAQGVVDATQPIRVSFIVPVQGPGPLAELHDAGLEVSFDDGASWREVPVEGFGARFDAPAGATSGFVSLRARIAYGDRATVSETVIRSFAYRRDSTPPPPPEEGCGCRVGARGPRAGASATLGLALLLGVSLVLRRRYRSAPRPC